MIVENTYSKLFWYKISVKPRQGLDPIKTLIWSDLPFELRTKYEWYFRYRAALLQVQYPKMHVQIDFGSSEGSAVQKANSMKNLIVKRKAQVTEWTSKIEKAKKHWNSLFPIEEDIYYKRAIAKLEKVEFELKELEEQYNAIKQQ